MQITTTSLRWKIGGKLPLFETISPKSRILLLAALFSGLLDRHLADQPLPIPMASQDFQGTVPINYKEIQQIERLSQKEPARALVAIMSYGELCRLPKEAKEIICNIIIEAFLKVDNKYKMDEDIAKGQIRTFIMDLDSRPFLNTESVLSYALRRSALWPLIETLLQKHYYWRFRCSYCEDLEVRLENAIINNDYLVINNRYIMKFKSFGEETVLDLKTGRCGVFDDFTQKLLIEFKKKNPAMLEVSFREIPFLSRADTSFKIGRVTESLGTKGRYFGDPYGYGHIAFDRLERVCCALEQSGHILCLGLRHLSGSSL